MIYIDLIDGKPAIDWERFDRLRAKKPHTSHQFIFTHTAIASLDGTPEEKLQQLEKLIDSPAVYEFAEKREAFCCRVQWQGRSAYGISHDEDTAKEYAQIDLLSILANHPSGVDDYEKSQIWDEYSRWDD